MSDYPYDIYIKTPESIGMSDKGDLKTLGKNITGLIAYTQLLVEGGGKASVVKGALGDKYFLPTGTKCIAENTTQEVDRYTYINNVPSFGGLIPGLIQSTLKINPGAVLKAALESSKPVCRNITLQTIDANNNKVDKTHYVAVTEIKDSKLTDLSKKSGFQNMAEYPEPRMPKDTLTQVYFASLAGLSVLLFYRLVVNRSP
jgi:hypothetical protein